MKRYDAEQEPGGQHTAVQAGAGSGRGGDGRGPASCRFHHAGIFEGKLQPRTDTLELLAERMGVTVGELLASPPPELERTESLMQAAGVLAALKPEKREKAVKLLLELAELIAGE